MIQACWGALHTQRDFQAFRTSHPSCSQPVAGARGQGHGDSALPPGARFVLNKLQLGRGTQAQPDNDLRAEQAAGSAEWSFFALMFNGWNIATAASSRPQQDSSKTAAASCSNQQQHVSLDCTWALPSLFDGRQPGGAHLSPAALRVRMRLQATGQRAVQLALGRPCCSAGSSSAATQNGTARAAGDWAVGAAEGVVWEGEAAGHQPNILGCIDNLQENAPRTACCNGALGRKMQEHGEWVLSERMTCPGSCFCT